MGLLGYHLFLSIDLNFKINIKSSKNLIENLNHVYKFPIFQFSTRPTFS